MFFDTVNILYKAQPFIYKIENKNYFIDGNKVYECKEETYGNYEKIIEIYEEYVKNIGQSNIDEINIGTENIKKFDIIEYYDNIMKLRKEYINSEYIELKEILKDKSKEILNSINEQNEIRINISRIVDTARLVKSIKPDKSKIKNK